MPHVGLLVGSEGLSMPQNVHAMLGTGQHHIHSIGCLQEAYRPIPTYQSNACCSRVLFQHQVWKTKTIMLLGMVQKQLMVNPSFPLVCKWQVVMQSGTGTFSA